MVPSAKGVVINVINFKERFVSHGSVRQFWKKALWVLTLTPTP
nr:hypothetical protein [Streptomyces sp. RK75]